MQPVKGRAVYLMPVGQELAAGLGIEEHVERVGGSIRYCRHQVGVHDVMDQRNMFVADALDVVAPIAVVEQGWAFAGLDSDDAALVTRFQKVAGRQSAGRTGAGYERGKSGFRSPLSKGLIDPLHG